MENEMTTQSGPKTAPLSKPCVFHTAWVRNNVLANVIGLGILHPFLAHYFTGPHDKVLTQPQIIMHTVSLFAFITLFTVFQNKALQLRFERKLFSGLGYFFLLVTPAFWFGYYVFYIPFDILFMYSSLGIVNSFLLKPLFGNQKNWALKIIWPMFLGGFVGAACSMAVYFAFLKDMVGIQRDFIIWTVISIPASIIYASMTGRYLGKLLYPDKDQRGK